MGYDNIEKLSAVIMRPCNNFVIKHVVKVAKKGMDGKRRYFHNEYTYLGGNYIDKKYLKSMNLDFYSYVIIEEQGKDWTNRETIMLTYVNITIFLNSLKKVTDWFSDEEFDDLFYIEDGTLKFNPEFGNLKEVVRLGENRTILFKPSVIEDNNGVRYEGVQMCVNTNQAVGFITLDNLMAMKYIFDNFNMYQSGLELINYLGRPEFDEFNHDIGMDNGCKEDDLTQISKRNNTGEMKNEFKAKLGNFFTSR